MIEDGFRPKSLGLLLLLRIYVFYVFFENPKNVTFYVFLLCFTRFLKLCHPVRRLVKDRSGVSKLWERDRDSSIILDMYIRTVDFLFKHKCTVFCLHERATQHISKNSRKQSLVIHRLILEPQCTLHCGFTVKFKRSVSSSL